jgi:hypothetical protein
MIGSAHDRLASEMTRVSGLDAGGARLTVTISSVPLSMEQLKQSGLPPKPAEPDPSECCNRGCERCIYVYYEEAVQRWEETVARLQLSSCAAE